MGESPTVQAVFSIKFIVCYSQNQIQEFQFFTQNAMHTVVVDVYYALYYNTSLEKGNYCVIHEIIKVLILHISTSVRVLKFTVLRSVFRSNKSNSGPIPEKIPEDRTICHISETNRTRIPALFSGLYCRTFALLLLRSARWPSHFSPPPYRHPPFPIRIRTFRRGTTFTSSHKLHAFS